MNQYMHPSGKGIPINIIQKVQIPLKDNGNIRIDGGINHTHLHLTSFW